MTAKELRAQRAKLIEDARALIDQEGYDAETQAKFDAMMADADKLKERIDRIEAADVAMAANAEQIRAAAQVAGVSTDEMAQRRATEQAAFNTWLRGGPAALSAEQRPVYEARFRAAQGTNVDTEGGYLVPEGFYNQLISAELAYGGMIEAAYVFDTTTGNNLPIPTDNDTSNTGAIIGESVAVSEQDVAFGSITLGAFTYSSKMVRVANQLLQDSAFDLNSYLSMKLGERIARITNTHFTTGDGAAKPRGLITGATLGRTAGGSTSSGSTDTFDYDDLIELEHSVDPAYRRSAKWMLADGALKQVKLMKDGMGRPIWMPGIAVRGPDTLLGYPYAVNQDMATPAASAKTVAFGALDKYFIRRVAGAQVMRLSERYADYNQTAFLAFQRWDGNLIDAGTHPVKYLQQSAT